MEENPIVSLLEKVKVDEEKFFEMMMPKTQECILELIRPSNKQLLVWKNTATGRKEFEYYVLSKFEIVPNKEIIDFYGIILVAKS